MGRKRAIVVTVLLCTVLTGAMASENWMGMSMLYDFSMDWSDKTPDPEPQTQSLGGEITAYTYFSEGNVGLRFGFDFALPIAETQLNAAGQRVDVSVANAPMSISLQFGPAFRFPIASWYTLYIGGGVSLSYGSQAGTVKYTPAGGTETTYPARYVDWMYGLSLDMGMRFTIGDSFAIRLGTTLGGNFMQYRSISIYLNGTSITDPSYVGWDAWTKGYIGFFVKPYLGISATF